MHSILLTNPLARGCGYGVAATLHKRGHAVHVAADPTLPGLIKSSRFFRSVTAVDAPRGTLLHGVVDRPNNDAEAKYFSQLLAACKSSSADMIFPSTEVDVIFLARNYKNFESNNIRVIALPIDILAKVSDKYTVIESAIEHGFPVAEARLCSSLDGLRDAASQLATFPLILKGRSGMGSGYIWKASSWHDVESSWIKAQGLGLQEIILQKFVLGGRERSFNYLISRDGELQCAFALAKPHHAFPSQSTSIVVIPPPPEMEIGAEMLRSLGVTGFAAMQTIFDAEDGKHKIIEINGRLGSNSRILHGMGIDLATWMVKAARGDKELNFPSVTVGAAGISVHESLLAVRSYFSARKRTSATAPSVFEFAASYLRLLSTLPRVDINTRSAPIDLSGYRHYVGSVWRQFSGMKNSSALVDLIPWGDLNVS